MTYYRDFLICCCCVVLCHIVHKYTTTEESSFDDYMTTNSPYHIIIGVIRAVYVLDCIVKVDSIYFVEYICLLFNKSFPFLEIAIYEYIPIVSELLRLAQSGNEQRVRTLFG